MRLLEALALLGDLVAQRAQLRRDLVERACAIVDATQLGLELGAEDADQDLTSRVCRRAVQDLVRRVEHGAEQLELLAQDLERERLRLVVLGQEVDDRDVALLTVAMAAPDALLDALRIPRQVVVDDGVAELEVQALGAGLGGDEDPRARPELVDEREPRRDVGLGFCPASCGTSSLQRSSASCARFESLVPRKSVISDSRTSRLCDQALAQVLLRDERLGEDDHLAAAVGAAR